MPSLLDIPPELRNAIYKLAIDTGKTLITKRYPTPIRPAKPPSLAHVCRQLRQEVLSGWRSSNIFGIDFTSRARHQCFELDLDEWLYELQGTGMQHVKRFEVAEVYEIPGFNTQEEFSLTGTVGVKVEIHVKGEEYEVELSKREGTVFIDLKKATAFLDMKIKSRVACFEALLERELMERAEDE